MSDSTWSRDDEKRARRAADAVAAGVPRACCVSCEDIDCPTPRSGYGQASVAEAAYEAIREAVVRERDGWVGPPMPVHP